MVRRHSPPLYYSWQMEAQQKPEGLIGSILLFIFIIHYSFETENQIEDIHQASTDNTRRYIHPVYCLGQEPINEFPSYEKQRDIQDILGD